MSVTTIPGTEVSVSNRDGISSEITANKDVETVLHNSARERVVLEELMQELHHCKVFPTSSLVCDTEWFVYCFRQIMKLSEIKFTLKKVGQVLRK